MGRLCCPPIHTSLRPSHHCIDANPHHPQVVSGPVLSHFCIPHSPSYMFPLGSEPLLHQGTSTLNTNTFKFIVALTVHNLMVEQTSDGAIALYQISCSNDDWDMELLVPPSVLTLPPSAGTSSEVVLSGTSTLPLLVVRAHEK